MTEIENNIVTKKWGDLTEDDYTEDMPSKRPMNEGEFAMFNYGARRALMALVMADLDGNDISVEAAAAHVRNGEVVRAMIERQRSMSVVVDENCIVRTTKSEKCLKRERDAIKQAATPPESTTE